MLLETIYLKNRHNICVRVKKQSWQAGVCPLPCHDVYFVFNSIIGFDLQEIEINIFFFIETKNNTRSWLIAISNVNDDEW